MRERLIPVMVWAVWLGCLVHAILFVRSSSSPLPYHDEWFYVGVATGEEPVTLRWLWQQHNEHRIPWAKLTTVPILRLTGFNYRSVMFFNIGVLATAAAMLLYALRQAEGRTSLMHLVIPLSTLSLHQENQLWAFQIAFFQFVWFVAALFALAITKPDGPISRKRLLASGVLGWLLIGTGGPGLGLLPGVLLWMIVEEWQTKRFGHLAVVVFFILTSLALVYAYFQVDFVRVEVATAPKTAFNLFRAWLMYLGNLPGCFQQQAHLPGPDELPRLGLVMAVLLLAGWFFLFKNRVALGSLFWPLLGLGLGMLAISLGIANSRTDGILASAPRYSTLALPWFWWLLLVNRTSRLWCSLILLLAITGFVMSSVVARNQATRDKLIHYETELILRRGAPLDVVANQIHHTRQTPGKQAVQRGLTQLQRANVRSLQGLLPEFEGQGIVLPEVVQLSGTNSQATVKWDTPSKPRAIRLRYSLPPGFHILVMFGKRADSSIPSVSRFVMYRDGLQEGTAVLWLGGEHELNELLFALITPESRCTLDQIEIIP